MIALNLIFWTGILLGWFCLVYWGLSAFERLLDKFLDRYFVPEVFIVAHPEQELDVDL